MSAYCNCNGCADSRRRWAKRNRARINKRRRQLRALRAPQKGELHEVGKCRRCGRVRTEENTTKPHARNCDECLQRYPRRCAQNRSRVYYQRNKEAILEKKRIARMAAKYATTFTTANPGTPVRAFMGAH
jgi:hypothetical protein